MAKYFRMAAVFVLALTIILSCTVVGNKLTDPATYSHTIEVLDQNRSTVLGLSAASAAASASPVIRKLVSPSVIRIAIE